MTSAAATSTPTVSPGCPSPRVTTMAEPAAPDDRRAALEAAPHTFIATVYAEEPAEAAAT